MSSRYWSLETTGINEKPYQDSQSPGQDLNSESPEEESRVLTHSAATFGVTVCGDGDEHSCSVIKSDFTHGQTNYVLVID